MPGREGRRRRRRGRESEACERAQCETDFRASMEAKHPDVCVVFSRTPETDAQVSCLRYQTRCCCICAEKEVQFKQ